MTANNQGNGKGLGKALYLCFSSMIVLSTLLWGCSSFDIFSRLPLHPKINEIKDHQTFQNVGVGILQSLKIHEDISEWFTKGNVEKMKDTLTKLTSDPDHKAAINKITAEDLQKIYFNARDLTQESDAQKWVHDKIDKELSACNGYLFLFGATYVLVFALSVYNIIVHCCNKRKGSNCFGKLFLCADVILEIVVNFVVFITFLGGLYQCYSTWTNFLKDQHDVSDEDILFQNTVTKVFIFFYPAITFITLVISSILLGNTISKLCKNKKVEQEEYDSEVEEEGEYIDEDEEAGRLINDCQTTTYKAVNNAGGQQVYV